MGEMEDFDDEEIEKCYGIMTRMKSIGKFLFILGSYSFAFVSLAHFGFFLAEFKEEDQRKSSYLLDWVKKLMIEDDWMEYGKKTTIGIGINLGLIALFPLQHSLMSIEKLMGTWYWDKFRNELQIDKAIYTLCSALVIQALVMFWQPIPLHIWSFEGNWILFKIPHYLAWALLYGSTLMMDLPELIGLNQVVITSPTVTIKSPHLQLTYRSQRHMGLLPFLIIFLSHPCMSLDRMVLAGSSLLYMLASWRSSHTYAYAKTMKNAKKYF